MVWRMWHSEPQRRLYDYLYAVWVALLWMVLLVPQVSAAQRLAPQRAQPLVVSMYVLVVKGPYCAEVLAIDPE